MEKEDAKNIASLINAQNNLPQDLSCDDVYYGKYFFSKVSHEEKKSEIICCVRAKRLSFFSIELKHLSVSPNFRRKDFGKMMVYAVEEYAKSENIPIVMATSCKTNNGVNRLFEKLGYTGLSEFYNTKTKNTCIIWQKVL